MKVKDIKCFSDIVIYLSAQIGNIISWPFRLIALCLAIPNIKIVYKSGHVERYFFRNIKISKNSNDEIRSLTWETVGFKSPFYLNVKEIESIHYI